MAWGAPVKAPRLDVDTPPADDRYLSLKAVALYTSHSLKSVRRWLVDPRDPLPHYRTTQKLLVRRSAVDAWLERRRAGDEGRAGADLGALVDDVMAGLRV